MNLLHQVIYSGPNIMGLRPCVRVVLGSEISPLDSLGEAFRVQAQALLAAALAEIHPGLCIQSDTPAGVFLESALLLQRAHRYPAFWSQSNLLADNRCEAAFEFMRSSVVNDIVDFALTLTQVALGLKEQEALDKIGPRIHKRMAIGLLHLFSHDRMTTAARLGVPCQTGYGMPGYLVRIGQGSAAQILAAGATVATSKLGRELAGEKSLTYHFLVERGLPVARQISAHGVEEAVQAAEEIGYPVVLKPLRANRGRGVSVNLQSADAVREAYKLASEIQTRAVVERYLPGDDYRLLVVDGKFTAAVQRPPPSVVGDGAHNLQELIDLINKVERRDGVLFDPISVNDEARRLLAEQGMQLGTVPSAGQRIRFRRSASPESTTIDVTDLVHPDNRAVAVAAARACFLDVAGVDFMSPDITRSWKENGAGIVEVNAGPAVDLHMYPREGKRRDISWHVIRSRLPARSPGRIPVVMVTGRYNKQAISRWSTNLLALCGYQVVTEAAPSPEVSAFTAPETDAGLLEMSLRTLALEGISLDRVAVTVISDEFPPSGDAGESAFIPDIAARLHCLAMDAACEAVVIDGSSAALRLVAQRRPAWQVGYIWRIKGDADDAPLMQHIHAGGWAVVAEADAGGDLWIKLWRGNEQRAIARMADVFRDAKPENGLYAQQREAMLACAALVGMGVAAEVLAAPLRAAALAHSHLSTLVVYPGQQPALASLDLRDRISLSRLAAFAGAGQCAQPWLVLPAERDILESVGTLCQEFDKLKPYWCVAGENRALTDGLLELLNQRGVPAWRILTFANVETAWEALQSQAPAGDLIALLSSDEILRRRLCREYRQPRKDAPAPDSLWSATELAHQFDGTWVNGARWGWGVNDIAWGAEGASNGGMAVIDGVPDDLAGLEQVERNILRAFERGAATVIAPMVPPGLPRWQGVLVCDAPARGLERLACAARRRFAGAAVALSGDDSAGTAAALRALWAAIPGATGTVFLDEARAGEGDAPSTTLALARTSPRADIALYPIAWDIPSIGQVKPALWIVLVRDQESELRAIDSLEILPPSCRIIAVVPTSSFSAWDKRLAARRTPLFILLDWESAAEETVGAVDEEILQRLAYAAHAMLYPRETSP